MLIGWFLYYVAHAYLFYQQTVEEEEVDPVEGDALEEDVEQDDQSKQVGNDLGQLRVQHLFSKDPAGDPMFLNQRSLLFWRDPFE